MSTSAFILLETNPINNISLDVLKPLLKTQGIEVNHSHLVEDIPQDTNLLFIEFGAQDAWQKFQLNIAKIPKDSDIILFNISENTELANRALLSGIRGVFYTSDNADVLMKGIRLLLDNQLWYRRNIMCNALNHLLSFNNEGLSKFTESTDETINLTKREKAITTLMGKGCKNKEIAEKLNISPHTVKTHLYSAFRKTKCRNRIELLSWAQQNIPNDLR